MRLLFLALAMLAPSMNVSAQNWNDREQSDLMTDEKSSWANVTAVGPYTGNSKFRNPSFSYVCTHQIELLIIDTKSVMSLDVKSLQIRVDKHPPFEFEAEVHDPHRSRLFVIRNALTNATHFDALLEQVGNQEFIVAARAGGESFGWIKGRRDQPNENISAAKKRCAAY